MELRSQINRQRVKHIVTSYGLAGIESGRDAGTDAGQEAEAFWAALEELLQSYSAPAIELALVEQLIESWTQLPIIRGMALMDQVRSRLQAWKATTVSIGFTPEQFQQITGLDPEPVFGSAEVPPPHPVVEPC